MSPPFHGMSKCVGSLEDQALHCIDYLDIVPVAGMMHIRNVLLIHDRRRAIVPGCSSKMAAVGYCLSPSICGADDTWKNRRDRGQNWSIRRRRRRGRNLSEGRYGHNTMDSAAAPSTTNGLGSAPRCCH